MSQETKTLEIKIDKIIEDMGDVKVTLARHEVFHETNTKSLSEHMARTKAAEQRIEMLTKEVNTLEKHKERVTGALLILPVIGAIITALYSMGILHKLI